MRTHPVDRKRVNTQPVLTGGLSRVLAAFGMGSPSINSSAQVAKNGVAPGKGGFYQAYEGDLFTPGTSNWVIDPTHDGPVQTVWGHGFLSGINQFNPLQTPQIMATPLTKLIGLSGLISGQIITQPLSENAQGSANS